MQCDKTISHMVTAGRSYFRTLRNAFVTAGKTTMTAGKIYHGCSEMLSWPHRTSANIINTCFWFLETCTKCSYFIEENIRPGAQRLAFEVKYEYIVRRPRTYRGSAACSWANFQTTGAWCVLTLGKNTWFPFFSSGSDLKAFTKSGSGHPGQCKKSDPYPFNQAQTLVGIGNPSANTVGPKTTSGAERSHQTK